MIRPMLSIIAVLCLGMPAVAQSADLPANAGRAIGTISKSAEGELSKSIAELNALRASIAIEKLPLSQQLTAHEEEVILLRREGDRVQRLVDSGALEIATLKAEIKTRQDELVYIGGLLDEYARTFETKVGVGELQIYGESIESAKQTVENKTLSPADRFTTQTLFTGLTAKRLFDVIGGTRFPGTGVDTTGMVMKGQFAMIGPVALFRADSGMAGVAVPQTGSPNPLIRPLEGALAGSIGTLIASGQGTLPLDPSRGGALKALIQRTNLWHLFEKGGPIMWPLLVASLASLAVVIERLLFLVSERRRRNAKALDRFFAEVSKGDLSGAIVISSQSKDAVVTTMGYALAHRDQSLGHALTYAETRTLKRYRRGIAILDTVITLAPLLGLLGTVTGMMASFSVIGGDLSSPGAITGGIAEALIATAFGLIIAIASLIPFNYLNNQIEILENEMLGAGEQLKLLVEGRGAAARATTIEPRPAPELASVGGGV